MKKIKRFFLPLLCLISLVALITLGFFYYQGIQSKKGKEKIDPILAEMGRMMILPSETPNITTIDDADRARERDARFFKDAKPGDKLIAYTYLLLLYDPKAKKIVNVQTFPHPPPTPTQPLRVALRYNGNEAPRVQNFKIQLEQASPNYQIAEVVISKATYDADVIYLVKKERRDDAMLFAQAIGDSPVIDKLEPNESPTEADIIVAFRDIP